MRPIPLHTSIINTYFKTKRRSLALFLTELPSFQTNNPILEIGCVKDFGALNAAYANRNNYHFKTIRRSLA